MKNIVIIVIVGTIVFFTGCTKKQLMYDETYSGLSFETKNSHERYLNFMFSKGDGSRDTVFMKVNIVGVPAEVDRNFKVEIVDTSTTAEVGVHYEALKDVYTMPANLYSTRIPVVFLNDETLLSKSYRLRIMLKETDDFKNGLVTNRFAKVVVTNGLATPPPFWSFYKMGKLFAGAYHPLKCRKFIEMGEVDGPNWRAIPHVKFVNIVKATRQWFEDNEVFDDTGKRLKFERNN